MAKLPKMNLSSYDSSKVGSGFEVPEDEYVVLIVESKVERNQNNSGWVCKLKMQIAEGDYRGMFLYDNLNVVHESEMSEKISRQRLKKLAESIGLSIEEVDAGDSSLLENKPVIADYRGVKGKPAQIQNYSPYKAQAPAPSKAPKQQNGSTPWAKGNNPPPVKQHREQPSFEDDDIPY